MKYTDHDHKRDSGSDHVSEVAPAWLGADTTEIPTKDSSMTQNEFLVTLLRMHSELMMRFERQMEQNREETNRRFEEMYHYMDKRFEVMQRYMDKRFEDMQRYMDKRFEDVNRRFEDMNKRFDDMQRSIEKRFEEINKRFEAMDKRFETMQKSIDKRFRFTQRLIMLGFTILVAVITVYRFLDIMPQ